VSFRSIKPNAVQSNLMPQEFEQFVLLGGYRGDADAFDMPLDASPNITDIRFERTGIRRDFGWAVKGAASATQIAAYLDHFDGTNHYTLRLVSGATPPPAAEWSVSIEYWNGAAWVAYAAGVGTLDNGQLVSAISIQDKICFCRNASTIWTVTGGNVVALSAGAPTAHFIFPFGDRIIALQSAGDRQSYAWCTDGVITNWTGTGSGDATLADVNGDAIDELVAGITVAHNSAALFRRRNIMKMFETGNIASAVGAVPAIKGIGTDSPFSIQLIGSAGAIFLGSDCMFYLLTPGFQLMSLGQPVVQDILSSVTIANRAYITSAYDYNNREYHALLNGTTLYTLDVGAFLDSQQIKWRSRTLVAAAVSYALGSPAAHTQSGTYADTAINDGVLFSDNALLTQLISSASTSKNGTAFTGVWRSPALNRNGKLGTLRMLTLRYRNGTAVNITVKASGDGGQSWNETKTVALAVCTNEIKEVNISLATTGSHLCFQIELDTVSSVEIVGYRPRIVERGGLEYA
jgi:hypothetical protein